IDQQKPLPASLTSSQFAVLEALLFHGPLKQAEISRKILKTPGNLTLVIENLVKAGLTERTSLADDRRVKIIKLTEKGRVLIETVFPNMKTAISRSFSVLTQNELQELSRLLKKLGTSEPG
ncbi:MAG: MarR family transcriptional regulator, partial [Spirochaetales bacterium]|nr:MarR family transcriptional regulator [Spirochaetales bacterium]